MDVNRAAKGELLRVPGLGPVTVSRILKRRTEGRLRGLSDLGPPGKRLAAATPYVSFA